MHRIRICSIILFVVACLAFGVMKGRQYLSRDQVAPAISMDKDRITVDCDADNEELLKGITAEDSKDGDVTRDLVIEKLSNFTKKGERKMTVAAFDSDGNVSKVTRTVKYKDYRSPRFGLEGPLKYAMDSRNIDIPLTAVDVIDGDITGKIKITGKNDIRLDKAGNYKVTFSVANSGGDVSELPVTIRVVDPAEENAKPQIELEKYLIYTKEGKKVDLWKNIIALKANGKYFEREGNALREVDPQDPNDPMTLGRDDFEIDTGEVKYKEKGTYEAICKFTDSRDHRGSIRVIIVVN